MFLNDRTVDYIKSYSLGTEKYRTGNNTVKMHKYFAYCDLPDVDTFESSHVSNDKELNAFNEFYKYLSTHKYALVDRHRMSENALAERRSCMYNGTKRVYAVDDIMNYVHDYFNGNAMYIRNDKLETDIPEDIIAYREKFNTLESGNDSTIDKSYGYLGFTYGENDMHNYMYLMNRIVGTYVGIVAAYSDTHDDIHNVMMNGYNTIRSATEYSDRKPLNNYPNYRTGFTDAFGFRCGDKSLEYSVSSLTDDEHGNVIGFMVRTRVYNSNNPHNALHEKDYFVMRDDPSEDNVYSIVDMLAPVHEFLN